VLADINLILDNCEAYNEVGSELCVQARKLRKQMKKIEY
jgi:hypothetical protein